MKQIPDYKNTEEYQKGIAVFKSKYEPTHISMLDDLYRLSPELADVVVAHGLYDIWERKTSSLSVREKELITLSSLITENAVHKEIIAHAYNCLNIGVSKQQIIELLVLLTLYIGVPKVILSSKLIQEAFDLFDKRPA
jgi:4-carboxymuconolactone decarboxylase